MEHKLISKVIYVDNFKFDFVVKELMKIVRKLLDKNEFHNTFNCFISIHVYMLSTFYVFNARNEMFRKDTE